MKKAKFLLPGAVTALSALCLAVIVWLAVAGRRDAAEFAEAAGAFEQCMPNSILRVTTVSAAATTAKFK